jgi:hypothetical protein
MSGEIVRGRLHGGWHKTSKGSGLRQIL